MLFDTGGALSMVDTIVIQGGDCDSIALTLYISYPLLGMPATAVKMNSCSTHVTITGLGDTVINVCPASVLPRVAAGRTSPKGNAAVRVSPRKGEFAVPAGAKLYNLDGTVANSSARRSNGGAAGIKVLVHRRESQ
jgi:hypothetical protein